MNIRFVYLILIHYNLLLGWCNIDSSFYYFRIDVSSHIAISIEIILWYSETGVNTLLEFNYSQKNKHERICVLVYEVAGTARNINLGFS